MRPAARIFAITLIVAASVDVTRSAAYAQGYWGSSPFSSWFDQPSYRPRVRRIEPRRASVPVPRMASIAPLTPRASHSAEVAPGTPLVAVVSLKSQSITVWDHNGPVLQSRVSTGTAGHATPTGLFSVIQKNRYHESNIYSGAPMPWMHRITWSGVALHAGVVPNYPASHGCIRLPYDVAPKLWSMSRMGMRVVVAPSDARLSVIEHPLLPQPLMLSRAEIAETLAPYRSKNDSLPDTSADADRLYNPSELAARLKRLTAIAVDGRKTAAREALAASALASAEANAAIAEARAAKAELLAAAVAADSLARTADASGTSAESLDRAALKMAADARMIAARQRYVSAVAAEAEKDPIAFAAARAARDAETAADAAPEIAREMARRIEPVSVFVSAKEGRVFIRQGFEPIFDAAVEIDDPGFPLGTHVFTAMAANENGTALHWSAVTMPSVFSERGGSAEAALERIKLTDKAREEISRRLWTGGSLIISDEGISNETGKGTDFVVLSK